MDHIKLDGYNIHSQHIKPSSPHPICAPGRNVGTVLQCKPVYRFFFFAKWFHSCNIEILRYRYSSQKSIYFLFLKIKVTDPHSLADAEYTWLSRCTKFLFNYCIFNWLKVLCLVENKVNVQNSTSSSSALYHCRCRIITLNSQQQDFQLLISYMDDLLLATPPLCTM